MIDSIYNTEFDRLVKDLTEYGKLEAIQMAVGNFDGMDMSNVAIDPKHILTVAEHYKNKEDFYSCLVLRLYYEASLLYESSGDLESAYEVLKQREEVKQGILEKHGDIEFLVRDLNEIREVNERWRNGKRFNLGEQISERVDDFIYKMDEYNKIHKEWNAIPDIYLELRQKYHLPVKCIEEAIEEIMSRGKSMPDVYVQRMKDRTDEHCDRQGIHLPVNNIKRAVGEILDGSDIRLIAENHRLDKIHSIQIYFEDGPALAMIFAETLGWFRAASKYAGDGDLKKFYTELADILSLPDR